MRAARFQHPRPTQGDCPESSACERPAQLRCEALSCKHAVTATHVSCRLPAVPVRLPLFALNAAPGHSVCNGQRKGGLQVWLHPTLKAYRGLREAALIDDDQTRHERGSTGQCGQGEGQTSDAGSRPTAGLLQSGTLYGACATIARLHPSDGECAPAQQKEPIQQQVTAQPSNALLLQVVSKVLHHHVAVACSTHRAETRANVGAEHHQCMSSLGAILKTPDSQQQPSQWQASRQISSAI